MPLAKQQIPLILGARDAGRSNKWAGGALAVPLTTCENIYLDQDDRYVKRAGASRLAALPSGTGRKLATANDGAELLAVNDSTVYAYSEASASLVSRGPAMTYTPTEIRRIKRAYARDVVVARAGGYIWYAYQEDPASPAANFGVFVTVRDELTGSIIVDDLKLDTIGVGLTAYPRIVALGGFVHVFYTNDVGGHIYVRRAAITAPGAWAARVQVDADPARPPFLDVAVISQTICLMWRTGATLNEIKLRQWDGTTQALTGSSLNHATAYNINPGRIGWFAEDTLPSAAGKLYFYYCGVGGTTLRVVETSTTFGAVVSTDTAVTDPEESAQWFDATANQPIVLGGSRAAPPYYVNKIAVNVGVGATTARYIWYAQLASRTWRGSDGNRYVVLTQNSTYFIVRADQTEATFDIAARFLPEIGGSYVDATKGLVPVITNGTTVRIVLSDISLGSATISTEGIMLADCAFDSAQTATGLILDATDVAVIPGGVLKRYDTRGISELGFNTFPTAPTLSTGGGGTIAAGTYRVQTLLVETDALGRYYESTPSFESSIVVGANSTITVTQPSYVMTEKHAGASRGRVQIEVYMTVAGAPSTDPPFYYQGYAINNPAAATATFTITAPPTNTTKTLYTGNDGATLENIPPPGFVAVEAYGERLWGIVGEDRRALWPSKTIKEGEGAAFDDSVLPLRFDDAFGDLTAICALGDKLIAFKRKAIYAVFGEGQDNNGNGAPFTVQKLKYDVGTDSPIVYRAEIGIVFRASGDAGFWIIDDGLQAQFIGKPVQDIRGVTLTGVCSVTLGSSTQTPVRQLRITTLEGPTFVYDLIRGRWYTFTGQACAGAVVYRNRFTYLDAAGVIRYEDATQFDDDGPPIAPVWETAWIPMLQIGGFGRLYAIQRIGSYLGSHRHRLTVLFDYGTKARSWDLDAELLDDVAKRYQVEARVRFHDQRCSVVKLRGEENFLDGLLGAGSTEELLALEVGLIPGRPRLPPTQKMTSNDEG